MEAIAKAKYQRVSPRKARLVANLVRGKGVEEAMATLKFAPQKAASMIYQVVKAAVANAEENQGQRDLSRLRIKEIRIDEGPAWKRYMPRAYGRATQIRKRTSHIVVVLTD